MNPIPKEANGSKPIQPPLHPQNMHEILVFCYFGAGMLAFVFSGVLVKCLSCLWSRIIQRRSHAAVSSAQAGSGYREVVVVEETTAAAAAAAAARVEVGGCSSNSISGDDCCCDGNNNNNNNGMKKTDYCLNKCTICICEIEDGDVCWELTACNHWFHADCIRKWIKKNKSCPLCRTVISVPPTS